MAEIQINFDPYEFVNDLFGWRVDGPEPFLVVIRGLPGSGKSTLAQKLFPGHLHYEPDHLFKDTAGTYRFDLQLMADASRLVFRLVDFALARKESVVVSDVFTKSEDVDIYLDLARQHGCRFRVLTCQNQFRSIHNVPVSVVENMSAAWEPHPLEEIANGQE